ncbi:transcriptional regulator, LacI family [Rathayibacter oskolensis]|uniref:Transcriptional regulator, LacI family n=1 Tax=Rathayibacter oskolensis TaxID=1891671 RepID=A0A1X7NSV3_9MICO|nr:LacI family DNA-binding transcriptional regulator [Rathayibacter oskolensis]SMH40301.1 transcriptional regulator, LacI family [Rathayibacter oskolensis]
MSFPSRRVTLSDVAAATGVSIGTVSKALNNRGQLRGDTRERIVAAARELGLVLPSAVEATPVERRVLTIGLVTSDDIGRFSIPVMWGLEDAFPAETASVLLSNSRGDRVRERHCIDILAARGVDAIVVMTTLTGPRPALPASSVPIVYVMGSSDDPADMSVVVDQTQGVLLALEHVAALGRRDIASVAGPRLDYSARVRAEAVQEHAPAFGLRLVGDRSLYGTWSETWGRQAAQMLRQRVEPIDAVICGSDEIARGVADGFREAGIVVPHDVAVVGFDNWAAAALNSRPALTTIDMNLEELGRAAGARALEAIEGRPRPGIEAHPCQLIVRDST